MSKRPCEIHVISNTHWDREWLYNFQETRMMLVEFFDILLGILDTEPKYKSFLLDSQTVPVEDYLEVRPENRARIVKHVKAGRLLVGPWYTAPEGFCVNGESIVRNLLYGHRVARSFGGVMKVGHTPFGYGQNSQFPQIYAGFGIDTMLFYHGVSHDETANEFIFEGADGTRILASQMSSQARYNFYHNVYRPVVFNETINDRIYHWKQGGLPFHPCGEGSFMQHHILLDPARGYDAARVEETIRELRDMETKVATTKYLAFMSGHDSSVADKVELRIIEEAQKHLDGDVLFHSSLPDYIAKVKKSVKNLEVLKGERRVPKWMDGRVHLYSDVLSSRTRMKGLNAQAEYMLQRWAEPFATLAWTLGAEYPATLLDLAWKTLLQCHAHDSIAGSGVDDIEQDVMYRLRQVMNISRGVKRTALQQVQVRINNARANENDVLVTVFNASPYPRSEVITATLDLPKEDAIREFSLEEVGGKGSAPVQVSDRKPFHTVVNHAYNATMMMPCERVTVHFAARNVPPMGYATYRVEGRGVFVRGGLVAGVNTMENEHLWVHINPDGTLTVAHKKTGMVFSDLNYFEDSGEAGHAWMHIEPGQDSIVTSLGSPVSVTLEENGPLLARYRIVVRMTVPSGLDENDGDAWRRLDGAGSSARRGPETKELTIASEVTLREGARSVEVITRFDNAARNHRLRALFPTNVPTDICHVESAFDVVEREIVFGPKSPWFGGVNSTFPMQRFVDVSGKGVGLAIINDGLREYEVTQTPERSIAITLMRAFEVSLTTVSKRWETHPEMKLSQCPGEHEFRYLIYPHAGDWRMAEVQREAERLCVPLEPAQAGAHKGGLPPRHSFLSLEPSGLVLSALKRSEDGTVIIIRVYNPTDRRVTGKLACAQPIRSAHEVDLEEQPLRKLAAEKKSLRLNVGKKRIVTLRLELA